MNTHPPNTPRLISPDGEARTLLSRLIFNCVNGAMLAGENVVVSATPSWDSTREVFCVDLTCRALGSELADFGGVEVILRYRSENVSGFPEALLLNEAGSAHFEVLLDSRTAKTARFYVTVPQIRLLRPLPAGLAADTQDTTWAGWEKDPVIEGARHCFSSDRRLRASIQNQTDEGGYTVADLQFRSTAELVDQVIEWAIGTGGRADQEGRASLKKAGKWCFTEPVQIRLAADRSFYFGLLDEHEHERDVE